MAGAIFELEYRCSEARSANVDPVETPTRTGGTNIAGRAAAGRRERGQCERRPIVFEAQVRRHDVAQAVMQTRSENRRGGVVAEVAEAPTDARLERRRIARS